MRSHLCFLLFAVAITFAHGNVANEELLKSENEPKVESVVNYIQLVLENLRLILKNMGPLDFGGVHIDTLNVGNNTIAQNASGEFLDVTVNNLDGFILEELEVEVLPIFIGFIIRFPSVVIPTAFTTRGIVGGREGTGSGSLTAEAVDIKLTLSVKIDGVPLGVEQFSLNFTVDSLNVNTQDGVGDTVLLQIVEDNYRFLVEYVLYQSLPNEIQQIGQTLETLLDSLLSGAKTVNFHDSTKMLQILKTMAGVLRNKGRSY